MQTEGFTVLWDRTVREPRTLHAPKRARFAIVSTMVDLLHWRPHLKSPLAAEFVPRVYQGADFTECLPVATSDAVGTHAPPSAGMLISIGLFCHVNRSLLTLTHTSGMLMSVGLFCQMIYSSFDTCAYLSSSPHVPSLTRLGGLGTKQTWHKFSVHTSSTPRSLLLSLAQRGFLSSVPSGAGLLWVRVASGLGVQ